MPEGPTIFILKEEARSFAGERILEAEGKTKNIDFSALNGKEVLAFKSWGKQFLICLPDFTIRVHLMLFGSWLINSSKELRPQLSLRFKNGGINFYACSVKRIDDPLNEVYDWSADVMSKEWDSKKAIEKLKQYPQMMVCDALLNQHIFSGVGNIIKNEVLFRVHIHPGSLLGKIPSRKLKELVKETVNYSYQFYELSKAKALKEHWVIYRKNNCPCDNTTVVNQILGKSKRRCFYCPNCQKLYS